VLCEIPDLPEDKVVSPELYDLLYSLLVKEPKTRISIEKALKHAYFTLCEKEIAELEYDASKVTQSD